MENEKEIKKAWEEVELCEKEQSQKDKKVLNEIENFLYYDEYIDVLNLIDEYGDTSHYSIEDKPNGEYIGDSNYSAIEGYWANQTTNGGFVGDEYAGTISVELSNGKYFQFHYSV